MLHYSASVKGVVRLPRFFCGAFPFFTPQKKQKNRENAGSCPKIVQEISDWTLG
jgi:hypothetical protein